MQTSNRMRRTIARVAAAGALLALPLGALAATAAAQAPAAGSDVAVVSDQVTPDQAGADIADHPHHHRHHPGEHPKFPHPGDNNGPGAFFNQIQPPATGSAG